ncbi:Guanylate kinase [Candidatus Ichthyocystis hellenicum]|uniref:Guanylate kinase n=2 Tax=Burkholderiales genera incertae sedis TaxID=224471 RepID=A0A0S4M0E1_9BURK|nr:Guanylate kinase [Candidatus Ichthyocystis hellenicum]
MQENDLFLISGASGAGKTSIVRTIISSDANLSLSTSFTTRNPRGQEKNGVDYHFISEDQFRSMIGNEAFIEWAEVHGNFYGTSLSWLKEKLKTKSVVLEIDYQGVKQVKEKIAESVSIFIVPPHLDILKERLTTRATDSQGSIKQRLKNAKVEMLQALLFDYVIINDDLDIAVADVRAIIRSVRLTSRRQKKEVSQISRQLP